MFDSDSHLEYDTLAAHAVDALPTNEVVAVGAHLATCERCQRELASLRAAAAVLPYGLAPAEPPPDLRERIVARARASRQGTVPARSRAPAETRQRAWWKWFPRLAPVLAALMLAIGFLLGRTWPPQQPVDLAERPGARTATLAGQGGGRFVVAPGDGQLVLSVTGLPPLPEGRVYQLWLMSGNTPISAGTFTVDANGRGRLEITGVAWSPGYNGVAITMEPLGGSAGPTSEILAQAGL